MRDVHIAVTKKGDTVVVGDVVMDDDVGMAV